MQLEMGKARWLEVLELECQRKSQKRIGEDIGYSSAVVNQVLQGKYRGDIGAVEQAVRGAYMGETVFCPVLGEIGMNACMQHQRARYAATNPTRIKLFRACRAGCPNSKLNPN